jgi:hypothetical protein
MKRSLFVLICLAALIFLLRILAADIPPKADFQKPLISDYTQFDANDIRAYITNYGSFFRHPVTGNSGFEWPKGSGDFEIYDSGLWVGAKVNGEARVAISFYTYEYAPGTIDIETHLPADPEDPTYKIYDIEQGNTSSWDYQNWPFWDGAPVDENGDPLLIGDQTLWCVYNDADSAVHTNMKSKPLGIEVQQTVFGWDLDYLNLKDVVFLRFLVINKSDETLDSTYLTLWCDSDLGDSGDDMTGTDSLLQLGFVYNNSNNDGEIGLNPPAVGITLLQGPIVSSPGDTAVFYGKKRAGYKNLPVNSIVCPLKPSMYINGSPRTYQDTYYLMQARWKNGSHMTYGGTGDDTTSYATNFMYTGDPVAGTGWLDPYPADKRFILNCGPVTMAPGDSQEVIFATHIAQGTSNLNSLTILKQQSQNLRSIYPDKLFDIPQNLKCEINYPNDNQIALDLSLDAMGVSKILGELYTYGSLGAEDTLLQTFNFYDDGQHHDGESNDGKWGASIISNAHRNGGYIDVKATFPLGVTITMGKIKDKIPLAGELEIVEPVIGSDNLNNDGIINPGENIRYTLRIYNHTNFDLTDLKIIPHLELNSKLIDIYGTSNGGSTPITIQQIPPNSIFNWEYLPSGPYLYFSTFIYLNYNTDDDVGFLISFEDENQNNWEQPVRFHLNPLAFQPEYNLEMNLIEGDVKGNFQYILVNPWELTGHTYQINFEEQEDNLLYNLKDVTTNTIKLNSQPLPDAVGHTSPLVDGFKILKGNLSYVATIYNVVIKSENQRWLTWVGRIELGNYADKWQGDVPFWRYPEDIKIIFDSTQTTFCKVYRIDQNYQVQPGLGTFYGAAYDESDSLNPRRLNIVFMENDTVKPADMIWNPDSTTLGGEELLFVMNSSYDAQNGGSYDNINFAPESDVLVKIWPRLIENMELFQSPLILNIKLFNDRPGLNDIFQFTPIWQNADEITYQLNQNYPNPLNNKTIISYRIIQPQRVKLEIFNILGQKVETLVDEFQQPLNYSVEWDAGGFASGVYFYRLTTEHFQKTRKLLLLK